MVLSKTTLCYGAVVARIEKGIPAEEAVKRKDPYRLIGVRYGRWTVESYAGKRGPDRHWICVCDCGTRKSVRENNFLSGKSMSCGCLQREVMVDAVRQMWIRRRGEKSTDKVTKKTDKIESAKNKTGAMEKAGIKKATYYAALAKAGKSPKYKILNKEARRRAK
jgi:hypothetical protein